MTIFQEIITGAGHSSAIDWWAVGKLVKFHAFQLLQFVLSYFFNRKNGGLRNA